MTAGGTMAHRGQSAWPMPGQPSADARRSLLRSVCHGECASPSPSVHLGSVVRATAATASLPCSGYARRWAGRLAAWTMGDDRPRLAGQPVAGRVSRGWRAGLYRRRGSVSATNGALAPAIRTRPGGCMCAPSITDSITENGVLTVGHGKRSCDSRQVLPVASPISFGTKVVVVAVTHM